MKSQIYNQAKYYEIAFGFIDAKKQGDLFEKLRTKYCLSESEGEEHLRSFESLEELTRDI